MLPKAALKGLAQRMDMALQIFWRSPCELRPCFADKGLVQPVRIQFRGNRMKRGKGFILRHVHFQAQEGPDLKDGLVPLR